MDSLHNWRGIRSELPNLSWSASQQAYTSVISLSKTSMSTCFNVGLSTLRRVQSQKMPSRSPVHSWSQRGQWSISEKLIPMAIYPALNGRVCNVARIQPGRDNGRRLCLPRFLGTPGEHMCCWLDFQVSRTLQVWLHLRKWEFEEDHQDHNGVYEYRAEYRLAMQRDG